MFELEFGLELVEVQTKDILDVMLSSEIFPSLYRMTYLRHSSFTGLLLYRNKMIPNPERLYREEEEEKNISISIAWLRKSLNWWKGNCWLTALTTFSKSCQRAPHTCFFHYVHQSLRLHTCPKSTSNFLLKPSSHSRGSVEWSCNGSPGHLTLSCNTLFQTIH